LTRPQEVEPVFHRAINFRDTSQSQSSGSDEGEEDAAKTLAEMLERHLSGGEGGTR
jgi:hypothetical protein